MISEEEDLLPLTCCRPPFASRRFLASLEALLVQALTAKTFSGASLLVAKPAMVLFHKTWGYSHHGGSPIDRHTLFDLASLTKPLITVPLCMHAVSAGKFSLDDRLHSFFPGGLLTEPKPAITIRQLLNHSSGLPAYEPFYRQLIATEPSRRQDSLLAKIFRTPLVTKPGTATCYSDLGFMVLSMVLETVYGKPLDLLASDFLLHPLRLELSFPSSSDLGSETEQANQSRENLHGSSSDVLGFCRLHASTDPTTPAERLTAVGGVFAATEQCPWRNRLLSGEVHDENAYCLGGVAGHAGLFGTAHGIHRLLGLLWDVYSGRVRHEPWAAEVVREFWTKPSVPHGGSWMLGFDTPSQQHSSAGKYFSPRSVGHLGFTGTSFWFDLDQEILIILLTNRVYPTRANERLKSFRPLVHNLLMEAYRHQLTDNE